jgi:hypothetical protein
LTISGGITNFTTNTSINTIGCFRIGFAMIICGMQIDLGTCSIWVGIVVVPIESLIIWQTSHVLHYQIFHNGNHNKLKNLVFWFEYQVYW